MANNGEIVPTGFWFCGNIDCNQSNQVELAPVKCSNCGHTRDACCKEAGDKKPLPNASSNYRLPFDGPSAVDLMGYFPAVIRHHHQYAAPHYEDYQFSGPKYGHLYNTFASAGAPAPGSWKCECGASNSSLTPDFCPVCGRKR